MKKLDLGAQFIHGNDGNPIFKLASDHGLLAEESDNSESESDSDDESEDGDFFTPEGEMIPTEIVREVCSVIDEILQDANKFSREGHPLDEIEDSIGTFAHRQFYKYLRTKCANESHKMKKMREGIFNWKFLNEKADNACRSLYETSILAWGEYIECTDSNDEYQESIIFKPQYGFGSIIEILLKSIPKCNIRLSTPVQNIMWDQHTSIHSVNKSMVQCQINSNEEEFHSVPNGDIPGLTNSAKSKHFTDSAMNNYSTAKDEARHPIKILVADGSEFEADHVIVTCSVGFLKRSAHHMFEPLLPNDKLAAIHRIGFGTVNKIFVEYAQPWWDKDSNGIQFAWPKGQSFTLNCVDNIHASEVRLILHCKCCLQ